MGKSFWKNPALPITSTATWPKPVTSPLPPLHSISSHSHLFPHIAARMILRTCNSDSINCLLKTLSKNQGPCWELWSPGQSCHCCLSDEKSNLVAFSVSWAPCDSKISVFLPLSLSVWPFLGKPYDWLPYLESLLQNVLRKITTEVHVERGNPVHCGWAVTWYGRCRQRYRRLSNLKKDYSII